METDPLLSLSVKQQQAIEDALKETDERGMSKSVTCAAIYDGNSDSIKVYVNHKLIF